MEACERCLRRGHLVGHLAPRIAAILGDRRKAPARILALADEALIDGVCATTETADAARAFLEAFDPGAATDALEALGIEAVCRHGGGYPQRLLDLDDPPAVLFVAGGSDRLDALAAQRPVTIVGTRHPSPYGIEVAGGLGRGLAAAGLTVVSGLALGIDGAAHRGACSAPGGGAIAVIACGPERCYPARHRELRRDILRRGCVISELPPGTPVFKWAFPARNRIMAALAEMTVVVEAADPSGSLITADFGAELHRHVGAVPGRVTAKRAAGSNGLLRDGAHVVLDARDVLETIYGKDGAPEVPAPPPAPLQDPGLQRVLDAVEHVETPHELAELTGLGAAQIRAALGRLELLELVVRAGAGRYARAAQ